MKTERATIRTMRTLTEMMMEVMSGDGTKVPGPMRMASSCGKAKQLGQNGLRRCGIQAGG